jgi:RNA polymerase sigma-70 factor (ECF subfamily)
LSVPINSVVTRAATSCEDDEVVRRVRAGETALFEVLMRRHNARVYRAVRAVIRDEGEVEDVMQQAYLSVFSHLDQFGGEAPFSTWLVSIAVHEAFGRLRRQGRFVTGIDPAAHDEASDEAATPEGSAEGRAAARELIGVLEMAIDRLPELYRTVFVLREVNGLGTAETARCLGISDDAVKVRLHRARTMLRTDIDSRLGEAATESFTFHASRCDRVVAAVMSGIPQRENP